jgi:hypothetical protein
VGILPQTPFSLRSKNAAISSLLIPEKSVTTLAHLKQNFPPSLFSISFQLCVQGSGMEILNEC